MILQVVRFTADKSLESNIMASCDKSCLKCECKYQEGELSKPQSSTDDTVAVRDVC